MKRPSGRIGVHWSIHPQATRPDLAPRFLPPPLRMCEVGQ